MVKHAGAQGWAGTGARTCYCSRAISGHPVDTLDGDQVVFDHINNPESAYAQTVILTAVKALWRIGI
jgi:hypothetical protein